jgi:FkbM family methyltransferase
LLQLLKDNFDNNYGNDNIDPDRPELYRTAKSIGHILRNILNTNFFKKYNYIKKYQIFLLLSLSLFKRKTPFPFKQTSCNRLYINKTLKDLSSIYNLLEDENSQLTFLYVIAYHILGFRKIKLPNNHSSYWNQRNLLNKLGILDNWIISNFRDHRLILFDLTPIHFPLKLFSLTGGIQIIFLLQQYRYSQNDTIIEAQYGDHVIDAGGCWGDTALYFAEKVGETGKIYTFEFIPSNIKIMEHSFDLNPSLKERICVVEHPLWIKSDQPCQFIDRGPSSRITIGQTDGNEPEVKTITIDDFVKRNNIPKIDLIKMDIEGAELSALHGAIETLRRFKPKLAISVYHYKWGDMIEIPRFIQSLNLNYKFYFDHFTLHEQESILFAI